MKVCLLNDSFPPVIDGVANVVKNYAEVMHDNQLAEVLVGTPRYPQADYDTYPYRIVPYRSFNTTKIVKGYRAGDPLDIPEIEDMAKFEPDIIHTHCPVVSTLIARILRAQTKAPIVFTYHTKFDVDIAKAVKAKFIQKETIHALVSNIEACDDVWVVSQGAGENLKSLGYQGEYRVVNNGVDFAKGRVSAEKVREATKQYDLPEEVPMFLFVGRIVRYKGIPLILEALKELVAAGQDFRMVFVGSGPDEKELKKQAEDYGLLDGDGSTPGKCLFVGPVYEREVLRAWNTRADLFLFPSTYDTNGIVVREAAACGLASVLIKGSCAAEGITDDRNGYMIDQTAQSLTALLEKACKDLDHVHQVGQNAMDEIYISWEESVRSAYRRYEELVDLKSHGELALKTPYLAGKFVDYSNALIEKTTKAFELPKKVFEGMLDNIDELL